jgi:hypothetical protein
VARGERGGVLEASAVRILWARAKSYYEVIVVALLTCIGTAIRSGLLPWSCTFSTLAPSRLSAN